MTSSRRDGIVFGQIDASLRRVGRFCDYERILAFLRPDWQRIHIIYTALPEYRLHDSIDYDHMEMVRYHLDRGERLNHPGADPKVYVNLGGGWGSRRQYRPLCLAIKNGNEEIVKLLLECGEDPNWYTETDAALLTAVQWGRLKIARLLIQSRTDVNFGLKPPIVVAVVKEDIEMFRHLLASGADLDRGASAQWP